MTPEGTITLYDRRDNVLDTQHYRSPKHRKMILNAWDSIYSSAEPGRRHLYGTARYYIISPTVHISHHEMKKLTHQIYTATKKY